METATPTLEIQLDRAHTRRLLHQMVRIRREVEIFEDGVIDQLIVQPGAQVPVGTVLATVRSNGAPAAAAGAPPVQLAPAEQPVSAPRPTIAPVVVPAGERVRASPVARKLAADLGVDLHTIEGSGPHGVVERADVERAAAARRPAEAAPAPATERPVGGDVQAAMRRAIAAAMARSNREIPHYYLETRIEMSRALRWLEAENLKRPIKDRLLPAVLLLKAVARALGDVPELNGYWLDDRHRPQEAIHIGFAIALRQGGLVTPAIHHADLKSLDELMEALRDLADAVRCAAPAIPLLGRKPRSYLAGIMV